MMQWEIDPPDRRRLVDGKLLERARIPRRYWKATLEAMGACEGKTQFVRYLEQLEDARRNGTGLCLFGEFGSGKTAAGCLALIDVLARSANRVFFVSVAELDWFARHRDETDQNGVPHWSVIVSAPFVLLDDFGSERNAPWNEGWFEEVVRARYNALLPTVLTTNLRPEALAKTTPWFTGILSDAYRTVRLEGSFR